MSYPIQVYKLPKNNNIDNFKKKDNLVLTLPYENYPLFSLGYHHFIDRTRDAMNITNKLETKNEFYYVVNPFESNVTNYSDDINTFSKNYFKNEIESSEFYKFWELCFIFGIADKENIEVLFLNDLGEKQAIEYYRNKFQNKKKDKFINKYKSGLNVDLIICNNKINKENQVVIQLLEDIIKIIESQKKKGNCIIKIDDTFTIPTLKLIFLLSTLYEEIYICKPYLSRPSDSEKFIILKNYLDLDSKKIIKNLEEIITESKKNYLTEIFMDVEIPDSFVDHFKFINIKFVNQQQIIINDIVKYIKENNYFGDKYHNYRNKQIEASEWWINNFYPSSTSLFNTNKENFEKLLKSTLDKNNLEKEKFLNTLN
jgi:hypothetical protein